jgi:DNA (cytosine-5)-methyltransferase 1
MRHLDLFSGIGGFALAVDTVWPNSEHIFCDNDKFCQAVLHKHWPESIIYGDIRELTAQSIANTESIRNRGSSNQECYDEKRILVKDKQKGGEIRCQSQRCISINRTTTNTKSKREQGRDIEHRATEFRKIDILTGGFPCQPFSQAGQRKGTSDDRYLWPEMFRVIREVQPYWIIAENVAGLITWNEGMVLEQVCTDLEAEGYEVQPIIIPACAVNAPHRRDRVWIIAHSISCNDRKTQQGILSQKTGEQDKNRTQECSTRESSGTNHVRESKRPKRNTRMEENDVANTKRTGYEREINQERSSTRYSRRSQSWETNWLEVATELCGVDDGLPTELDGLKLSRAGHRNARIKALGNAIVPQVAIEIMKAIQQSNENDKYSFIETNGLNNIQMDSPQYNIQDLI